MTKSHVSTMAKHLILRQTSTQHTIPAANSAPWIHRHVNKTTLKLRSGTLPPIAFARMKELHQSIYLCLILLKNAAFDSFQPPKMNVSSSLIIQTMGLPLVTHLRKRGNAEKTIPVTGTKLRIHARSVLSLNQMHVLH